MLTSILAFVIAFGVLVLVHEFGHFWVAKKTGIFVEKFSIGFGPKIAGFKWGETNFCISLFPLGGFVKMRGEGDESEVSPDDPRAFSNKKVSTRAAVVVAGPVMNIILSFLLMPFVFWIGKPEISFLSQVPVIERILPGSPAASSGLAIGDLVTSLNGKPTPTWESILESLALTPVGKEMALEFSREETKQAINIPTAAMPETQGSYLGFEKFFGKSPDALIQEIVADSPAQQAGLQPKDLVTKVNGKTIHNWDELIREVNAQKGETILLDVLRGESSFDFQLKPQWDATSQRWLIGIRGAESLPADLLKLRRYGFWEGLKTGFQTNIKNIGLTFDVLKKLVTLQLSYKTLGGPIQIAYSLGKASASGIANFLYFTAFLSLQLAILNILPIPMLDGGHLLFFATEAIRGRPLSLKTRMIAQQVGLVLLLTLIFFVTVNDLERLLGISKWFHVIFN